MLVREAIVVEPSLPEKLVQSVVERQPAIEPEAVRQLRALPENWRPEPIVALVRAPVPLPVRMPPRVVEPVPP